MRSLIDKVNIPEGQSGNWRVEHFEISEDEAKFENMRCAINGRNRYIRPGNYTRLMHNDTVVMSDTPAEMRDHYEAVRAASGHCLVNGLGLGMVVCAMLDKRVDDRGVRTDDPNTKLAVDHVTVIEKSEDVIRLVGPALEARYGDRLTIVHADAYDYKPPKGVRYNAVWHDIWNHLCVDNLPLMHKLHRKYGRRAEWQGSWGRELLEYQRRQHARRGW